MAPVLETHMVPGDGDTSYSRNSTLPAGEQGNVKPMIEEAIESLPDANLVSDALMVADLGCSSGPNALVLVSTAVDAVRRRCLQLQQPPPELCLHLNDLPGNDFNSVIKSLATYREAQEVISPVITSVVPGSFHGRLFSKRSLHLVCSTTSLHWLSKAPEELVQNGIPFYDRDEVVRRSRRSMIVDAYARQFEKDFTSFLRGRAQEMVPGGRMVFSMIGQRPEEERENSLLQLDFLTAILREMASVGLIDKEKLDSFYIPAYGPSEKELREIIEAEASFTIVKMAIHEPTICVGRDATTPYTRARGFRAVMEPMILQHFGSSAAEVMDEFVTIAERLIKMSALDEYPNKPRAFVAASLVRRT
ncbi:hypothetical protein HU200_002926 [Digitaria exilis]|uniref:Uncharacterized protein n=1 Tax=Digitaria exilis TaxID=1010633 RepID=A0A835KTM2_9POAL|nr:hypothetical protein HU200_002926 [Digitaria exilis]